MAARTRPSGLLVKTTMTLVVMVLAAAAFGADRAAATTGPSPADRLVLHIGMVQEPNGLDMYRMVVPAAATIAAEKKPAVNWTWLAIGLGGVALLLVIMLFLTFVFRRSRRDGED